MAWNVEIAAETDRDRIFGCQTLLSTDDADTRDTDNTDNDDDDTR